MLRIAAVSINHICVRGDYALQELRCIHFVCLFVFFNSSLLPALCVIDVQNKNGPLAFAINNNSACKLAET